MSTPQWKDTSSYERGEKDRTPKAFALELYGCRLNIFRSRTEPFHWKAVCYGVVSFSEREVGPEVDVARAKALILLRETIKPILSLTDCMIFGGVPREEHRGPVYDIEIRGRSKDEPESTAIVYLPTGAVGFRATLTEVALLGALKMARRGASHAELWDFAMKCEAVAKAPPIASEEMRSSMNWSAYLERYLVDGHHRTRAEWKPTGNPWEFIRSDGLRSAHPLESPFIGPGSKRDALEESMALADKMIPLGAPLPEGMRTRADPDYRPLWDLAHAEWKKDLTAEDVEGVLVASRSFFQGLGAGGSGG